MGKATDRYGPPPIYYADQPAELAMGPLICKLTLGVVEMDSSNLPRPVVTVVMPTSALLQLATDVMAQFADPQFKQHAIRGLQSAAKAIEAGVIDPSHVTIHRESPSDDLIEEVKPKRITRRRITSAG